MFFHYNGTGSHSFFKINHSYAIKVKGIWILERIKKDSLSRLKNGPVIHPVAFAPGIACKRHKNKWL